jgi:hypothetical protein
MNGPRQGRRHVLRSRGFDTPLHERPWKLRGVNVRELSLQRHHRASLLPSHDHQWLCEIVALTSTPMALPRPAAECTLTSTGHLATGHRLRPSFAA